MKLEIEPVTTKDPKHSRVRHLVIPILRNALPSDMETGLIQQDQMEAEHVLFALFRKCSPGRPEERAALLKRIQNLSENGIQPTHYTDGIDKFKNWNSHIQRFRTVKSQGMDVATPDPSPLWKALQSLTELLVSQDQDLAHKIRDARNTLEVDHNPTIAAVGTMYKLILSEFESKSDTEVVLNKRHQKKQDTQVRDALKMLQTMPNLRVKVTLDDKSHPQRTPKAVRREARKVRRVTEKQMIRLSKETIVVRKELMAAKWEVKRARKATKAKGLTFNNPLLLLHLHRQKEDQPTSREPCA